MALIIILLCIGVQRYLGWNSYSHQVSWLKRYVDWMTVRFSQVMQQGNGYIDVAILVVPILVVLAVVFTVVAHLLGDFAYFLLNALLLWYCLDARDIKKEPYDINQPEELLVISYKHVFAVIFWFAVFGPIGLALYSIVGELRSFLQREQESHQAMSASVVKVQGVLDWVPIRLVGLSFALVGHFASVFKQWLAQALLGIKDNVYQVADWGMTAVRHASSDESSDQADEVVQLIDRSLLVWLVCIALFTIGYWWG